MKTQEYKARAIVSVGGFPIDYESGWQMNTEKAVNELNKILEDKLPAGMYQIAITIKQR